MKGAINMLPAQFSGAAVSASAVQLLLPNAADDSEGCLPLRNVSLNKVPIKGNFLMLLRGVCSYNTKVGPVCGHAHVFVRS